MGDVAEGGAGNMRNLRWEINWSNVFSFPFLLVKSAFDFSDLSLFRMFRFEWANGGTESKLRSGDLPRGFGCVRSSNVVLLMSVL